MLMYETVFQILKNKIDSRLLPEGSSLPSRADLCMEFGTSEKTIRRALAMLEDEGLIETSQRKRPVVSFNRNAGTKQPCLPSKKLIRISQAMF